MCTCTTHVCAVVDGCWPYAPLAARELPILVMLNWETHGAILNTWGSALASVKVTMWVQRLGCACAHERLVRGALRMLSPKGGSPLLRRCKVAVAAPDLGFTAERLTVKSMGRPPRGAIAQMTHQPTVPTEIPSLQQEDSRSERVPGVGLHGVCSMKSHESIESCHVSRLMKGLCISCILVSFACGITPSATVFHRMLRRMGPTMTWR